MTLTEQEKLDLRILRSVFLHNVPQVIIRRESANTIFAQCSDEPDLSPPPVEQVISWRELLDGEYNTLGFYISGHPLDDYSQVLAKLPYQQLSSIESMPDKTPVGLAGLFREVKVFTTKRKKEQMAICQLETRQGRVKVCVWPEMYREVGNIYLNVCVWIMGRTMRKEDEALSIELEDIEWLEKV